MTLEIKLEVKAYCNIIEALEYLAMGWKPYKDNDERLLLSAEDRDKTRCDFFGWKLDENHKRILKPEQIIYYTNMYKAVGWLDNIIRNNKIKLYADGVLHCYRDCFYCPADDKIQKQEVLLNIESVDVDFDSEEKQWEIFVAAKQFGLLYKDAPDIIKFSELEPFYTPQELPEEKQYEAPAVSYTTPYLELINIMLRKGYVTKDNSPLADNLKEDIKKEAQAIGIKISDRLAASMATILRPPELQKGGYKK